jgi:hypothetical protein
MLSVDRVQETALLKARASQYILHIIDNEEPETHLVHHLDGGLRPLQT